MSISSINSSISASLIHDMQIKLPSKAVGIPSLPVTKTLLEENSHTVNIFLCNFNQILFLFFIWSCAYLVNFTHLLYLATSATTLCLRYLEQGQESSKNQIKIYSLQRSYCIMHIVMVYIIYLNTKLSNSIM